MVCGKLPLYLNNTGADDDWVSIGQISLRVPDSTSPSDLLDLNDNLPAPDDTRRELELPTDLGTQLANAVLDFGNFGDGLEGYLARIESAFRVASFQGNLPLIGDDLQQGADFIGDLRTSLRNSIWNELPGGGRPANSTEFKNFINAQLAGALAGVDIAAHRPHGRHRLHRNTAPDRATDRQPDHRGRGPTPSPRELAVQGRRVPGHRRRHRRRHTPQHRRYGNGRRDTGRE